MRAIAGLLWAAETPAGPFGPQKRRKGTKRQGLGYEKKIAKALPRARFNPWFHFVDANGSGYCQPDFIQELLDGSLLILEAKLTDTPTAYEQIERLYRPILQHIYPDRSILGMVICKNLAQGSRGVYTDLEAAIGAARKGVVPTFHWLGHTPLRSEDF